MKCVYRMEFTTRCPVDVSVADRYQLTVEAGKQIWVERLIEFCARDVVMSQEQWASAIADEFNARVCITGTHSNVHVEVTAP